MYGIYVRFAERDISGKRLYKSFVKRDKDAAETLYESVASECRARWVNATIDLIDLNEGECLQRETIDMTTIRQMWESEFPPILGVRTY